MIMVFTNILTKHQNNFIHTKCVVLLRTGGIYIRRRSLGCDNDLHERVCVYMCVHVLVSVYVGVFSLIFETLIMIG